MPARKGARGGRGRGQAPTSRNAIPTVYRDMLAEVTEQSVEERAPKRPRTGRRKAQAAAFSTVKPYSEDQVQEHGNDDGEEDFEDVLPETLASYSNGDRGNLLAPRQPSVERDSDDDVDESDSDFDIFKFAPNGDSEDSPKDISIVLEAKSPPNVKRTHMRRKAITKEDRDIRLIIHKMHILCMLSHVEMRNQWCNDAEVKSILKLLLTQKTISFLRPRTDLSQFSQGEALKRGLTEASVFWQTNFRITARGLRKALWADDERDLKNYKPPDDADSIYSKSDFREAARKLAGSRDLGAQLFCALLRSVGVKTRLVCSLQPLSFSAGGPSMRKALILPSSPILDTDVQSVTNEVVPQSSPNTNGLPLHPRRRLGHPNAANYHLPDVTTPSRPTPQPRRKVIHESKYPVYWVEVFDQAYQKWYPVDALVSGTVAKRGAMEPPIVDHENSLIYVVAFEKKGRARDVTLRYTKAYNAKTRKNRVETTHGGAKWWGRTMRYFARGRESDEEQIVAQDADQIEDAELAGYEAQEPMPRNIVDFKDHPIYALERHLRRNEVIINLVPSGRVAAGKGGQMVNVFRRKNVKIAKSADAWYRLGREVKLGEAPVKTIPRKQKPENDGFGDEDTRVDIDLYTEDQTELYEAPPVVNGRVPVNEFGNLDLYVPTMLPKGGVHLPYDEASHAAHLVGVHYADALVGFHFQGRRGTAVLKGVVIAEEYCEAVEAVISGLRDEQARAEEEARSIRALGTWRRFLRKLRIIQDVNPGYLIGGEELANTDSVEALGYNNEEKEDMESDVSEYVDDYGGGFFPD